VSIDKQKTLARIFPVLQWWPDVNKQTLRHDFIAGLTGSIIALPQGVAFALIAGMPPIYGLYTAIVVPIVAALFGSSRHLISGPATAISLVVFASISPLAEPGSEEFIKLAFVLTFLAGAFQLGLGMARLGILTNFVSHTVVIGFTAGAAILIITSQMKHILGIDIPRGEEFLEVWRDIFLKLSEANPYVVVVGVSTFLIAIFVRRIHRNIPHLLVAMVLGSVIAQLVGGETRGISFVGEMPAKLPPFNMPELTLPNVRNLAGSAFAVALLGLIEAVAIGRSISTKSHQRIDGNQEFVGQGLSNIVGSFFSCYAGSGSFTRSGVNYQAGAKTPMSSIFAAVLLLIILLLVAPLAAFLPLPAMGGIILLVGYNLIDFEHIRSIIKASKREISVLAVTFFSTLFLELEFAIYIGIFLSLLYYLHRTSQPHIAVMAPDPNAPNHRFVNIARKELEECPQLKVVRIDGSLYYGAVDHVASFLQELSNNCPQRNLLIIASGINFIDVTGAEFLVQEAQRWKSLGGNLFISGLKRVAQDIFVNGGYRDEIGEDHVFRNKRNAIRTIYEKFLDKSVCESCTARIFEECREIAATAEMKKKEGIESK
jgi:SulP family sulfate permease